MSRLSQWLVKAGLDPNRYDVRRRAEQRNSMERVNTAPGQRSEIQELAGGVEAPADAEKMTGAEAPAELRPEGGQPGLSGQKGSARPEERRNWNRPYEPHMRPALRIVSGRSIATVSQRRRVGAAPAPAVVIDLLLCRERHHSVLANSP